MQNTAQYLQIITANNSINQVGIMYLLIPITYSIYDAS